MTTPGRSLDEQDLADVLDRTRDVWTSLRGAGVLLTGVTGFVGSWLLETLLAAEARLDLGLKAIVVVRDADAFRQRLPHLASSSRVHLRVGDVRSLGAPAGAFTHVVHSASAATARLNAERPDEVVDIIQRGTQRVLEAATHARASRFLQVSSGSIYGVQPPGLERIDETYTGRADPTDPMQRFGDAKRRAEELGEAAAARGLGFVSARAFGLIGPRLPLDGQFAIGNFFADALAGRRVAINGDGTPVRTWMYAADLTAWCWTLLAKGRVGAAYNVGAEEALTIGEAAERIAALPTPPVAVARAREPEPGAPVSRLVPSIRLARDELGLDAWTGFDDALARTWRWLTT